MTGFRFGQRRGSGRVKRGWSGSRSGDRLAREATFLRPRAGPGGGRTAAGDRPRGRTRAIRAAAALGLLVSAGAIVGLTTSPAFGLSKADLPDLRWTSREAVEATIQLEPGTNVFGVSVGPIVDRLGTLPSVAGATVEVVLPDRLVVRIHERVAILAWRVGERAFLVDRDGAIFADVPADDPAATNLHAVVDTRARSIAALLVGGRLDAVDLDAATRLGSLVPADLGSVATGLTVAVSDAGGFVLGTTPASWVAVFGAYTLTRRTPDLIPGQVRLLRSLLADREATIARVILADDRNGTYVPRSPAPSAPPSASPAP